MGTVTCANADFSEVLKETVDLTKRTATLTTSGQSVSLSCEGWTDDSSKSLQFDCRGRDEKMNENYIAVVSLNNGQGFAQIAVISSSVPNKQSGMIDCQLAN